MYVVSSGSVMFGIATGVSYAGDDGNRDLGVTGMKSS